ncbi:tubulin monoglutamylase TTLL4-like [Argiope bruennichi]|uniref:tubulin monoglutamylase TTLL4-like n=1 Tax=Argiope bruennichi TaxID=94029 RepID=UPI002493FB3F|nr:tubulin monoglutamylase TTLL4-like [Argiope bruennichi]XP_055939870.1 tubulin monoglutamylase TTLL4-like [Argiope bruennichi]
MSNTLVCLTETVPFYTQELCKDSPFKYETFPPSCEPTCGNLKKALPITQDENNCTNCRCSTGDSLPRPALPRKREASNVLVESVKRRDNLRNIGSEPNVPCDSFHYDSGVASPESESPVHSENVNSLQTEHFNIDLPINTDFSDSLATDSGIESSKSTSPAHNVDTSSTCCLDDDVCQDLMEIDTIGTCDLKSENETSKVCELGNSPKSVESSAAHLDDLHLSDATAEEKIESENAKSPIMQSLFKNVPSVIYFSTKDETVSAMPEHVVKNLKWKLSTITPAVIRQTVLKTGFSLVEADTTEDWLGTWGKHLKNSSFKRIKHFQKVNHYPGGFHLGRKDRLWENYRKMVSKFGAEAFNFFPETYILPADLKALKETWGSDSEKCWIVKPCASARGTGVKVIYKWSQVPKNRPFVVQRYISDPYLINGSKFDLRVYVMVPSIEPLRIYIFKDGLVRFASEKYSLANKSFANRFIHLTNYSINKKSSSYTSNDDETMCQGHKWSLKSFWDYMSNSGIDVEKIQATIRDMIIKTIISAEGPICRMLKNHAKKSYNCFELFGFDIMLDKDLHPWLLEVNISPSLHTKSMLDSSVKGPLVKDMLNIAGFEIPDNEEFSSEDSLKTSFGNRHKPFRNRGLSAEEKKKHALYTYKYTDAKSDILTTLTLDDLQCLVESEDELYRAGSFTRIYPTENTSSYFTYFDHIRYYNVLLDAWEKMFHSDRNEGIKLLQGKCEELLQRKEEKEQSTESFETKLKSESVPCESNS